MNSALIMASGIGSRINSRTPKQYLLLNGKSILSYSVETFRKHSDIDEIIIAVSKNDVSKISKIYPDCKIIAGGDIRQESSKNAVNAVQSGTNNVLIHDAARPFISNRIITECIDSLKTYECAAPIIDSNESLISFENGKVKPINRALIKTLQTPQAFHLNLIYEAQKKTFNATDEIGLVYNYKADIKVHFIAGDINNFKITTPMDMHIAEYVADKLYPNN